MMRKSIVLFVAWVLLVGCAGLTIDMKDISIGMSKNEVFAKTKNFSPYLIGAKTYPDGVIEVVQVSEYYVNRYYRYWIFIFNEKVVAWYPITAQEQQFMDFDFKADKVYYDMKQK